tara:strand:+ start:342 stop:557 length:216 start_codon:yes stop_codon:yes gene_type:complete
MTKQTILKFSIRQDGTVTEEVTGLKGTQCLDLTEKIEKQLGTVQWRKETDEYYQTVTEQENVTLQRNQDQN